MDGPVGIEKNEPFDASNGTKSGQDVSHRLRQDSSRFEIQN